MGDESHLDEMRSAIRGDFERLAERRGEQELMRLPGPTENDADVDEPAGDEEPPRSWWARMLSP